MTTEDALNKINEVHGEKYQLEENWEYKNAKTDIKLFCPIHGEFHKDFYRLVNLKQGCPTCSYGQERKCLGYWNDYNHCLEEARKYKNKFELERKSIGCYNSMRRNGWLDEIADKIYNNSINYMKYDEAINLIYVYEFKDFCTFYVGRTNNLKRRDKQHRNGYNHTDGIKTYDNVYKFAQKNNVEMPTPIVLEESLTAQQSQEMEDYWLNKYIKDGWFPINKGITGIGKGSLGATLRWTYDACKDEASKYESKNKMKIGNQSAYNTSVKNGWIDDFFEDKKKKDNYWDIMENVLDAASKSKNARDMVKKFGGAYNSAKKHKWLNLLKYGTGC